MRYMLLADKATRTRKGGRVVVRIESELDAWERAIHLPGGDSNEETV